MVKHVVYPRDCCMYIWGECVFCFVGWCVLQISERSYWFIVLLMSTLLLLLFHLLAVLFLKVEYWSLQPLQFIYPFSSVSFCLRYFETLLLGTWMFVIYVFLMNWHFNHYKMSSSSLVRIFILKFIPPVAEFIDSSFMEVITYHCLGLGFIALALKSKGKEEERRNCWLWLSGKDY